MGTEQTREAPAATFYFQCVFPETVFYVMLNSVVLYFIRADVQAKLFAEFSLMPEKNDTRL